MSNKRTGNYDKYARLLNKYKVRQPAEKWSKEQYKEESKNQRITEYLHMSEYIMDSMKLVGTQRRDVKWLIKNVSFNELAQFSTPLTKTHSSSVNLYPLKHVIHFPFICFKQ